MKNTRIITAIISAAFLTSAIATLPPNEDRDNDGWTNLEEEMNGTDPTNSVYFPRPVWNINFSYYGDIDDYYNQSLVAYSYSEKTSGTNMGGQYDGVWMQDGKKDFSETVTFDGQGQASLSKSSVTPRTIQISGTTTKYVTSL